MKEDVKKEMEEIAKELSGVCEAVEKSIPEEYQGIILLTKKGEKHSAVYAHEIHTGENFDIDNILNNAQKGDVAALKQYLDAVDITNLIRTSAIKLANNRACVLDNLLRPIDISVNKIKKQEYIEGAIVSIQKEVIIAFREKFVTEKEEGNEK